MLKFFRRIRQRLMHEGRFSRYLLYAFGEVLLIVIGIVIALQLNNWNEMRKNREEIVTLLKEFAIENRSNIYSAYFPLAAYQDKDSIIRLHLCNAINPEDIRNNLQLHWYIGQNWFPVTPMEIGVFEKIMLNLDHFPKELENLKTEFRLLGSRYSSIQGVEESLSKNMDEEAQYQIKNISWKQRLLNWNPRTDHELNELVFDFILNDPHYRNYLDEYNTLVFNNTVPRLYLFITQAAKCQEMIIEQLKLSEEYTFKTPPKYRNDLKAFIGTFKVERLEYNDSIPQIKDLGNYTLYEDDGRLFSNTRWHPGQDKYVEAEQAREWIVINNKAVISATRHYMYLTEEVKDSLPKLAYAGCNTQNLYFTKIE